MEAKHLKRLADVSEIAKLDLNPGAMTIAPIPGGTLAWYGGAYTAAGIKVAIPDQLPVPVSVSAQEFHDLADLFDDEANVNLVVQDSALVLTAGKRKVSLRYNGKPDYEQWATVRAVEGHFLELSREALIRELGVASGIAAVSLTNPALTGIRVVGGTGVAGVQAANGSSLVFQSAIPSSKQTEFDALIPAKDVMVALPVVRDEDKIALIIQQRGTAFSLIVRGENSIVKMGILAAKWPSAINQTLKQLTFDESLSVPVSAVRSLASAARTYKASNDVTIRPSGDQEGFVTLETSESELGQFQEALPGSVSRSYTFDVADLDTAGRLTDQNLSLELSAKMARVTVGTRKLFINVRVV